jgi:predicted transposase YdaD
MAVLRESPWYQEIEEKGALKGEQSLISRQLSRRIGNISSDAQAQIQALPLSKIEALGEALLDFSTSDDLTNWLQANQT